MSVFIWPILVFSSVPIVTIAARKAFALDIKVAGASSLDGAVGNAVIVLIVIM
jgi:hypothetical protein